MSISDPSNNRRQFLKTCAAAIVAAPAILSLAGEEVSAQDITSLAPVDPATNTIASGLGYVADATKVDVVKFPKRKSPEGDKQFCSNCTLFIQGPVKIAGSDEDWGKCVLFQNNLVNAKGWCNTWALKAT